MKAGNPRGKCWAIPLCILFLAITAVSSEGQDTSSPQKSSSKFESGTSSSSQPSAQRETPVANTPSIPTQAEPQTTDSQSENPSAPGTSSSQSGLPEAPRPQQKQEENTADKTKDITKDIAKDAEKETEKLGEVTLDKLQGWERGWLTGPYTSRRGRLVPFTNAQRKHIFLQQTLTTPSAYVKRMFVAGGDQIREAPLQWGDGWGAYAERFASREGQFITANSVAALGNWALKYDPIYDQCKCRGFGARTKHAILRSFLTYNQTESELRPQWALFGGAFAGGAMASVWKPRPQNVAANGAYAMVGQVGYGALLNFFIEFAGDINRKMDTWREQRKR